MFGNTMIVSLTSYCSPEFAISIFKGEIDGRVILARKAEANSIMVDSRPIRHVIDNHKPLFEKMVADYEEAGYKIDKMWIGDLIAISW